MVALGSTEPGVVWCNADDETLPAYRALNLPAGWRLAVIPPGSTGVGDVLRAAFAEHCGDPWFGLIPDDTGLGTAGFERRLIDAAGAWGIASSNDGVQAREDVSAGRMTGAIVFGGELLRALGYLLPAGLHHLYGDDVWETVGRQLGCWRTCMDIEARHDQAQDATHAGANTPATYAADGACFRAWRAGPADEDILRARLAHWEAQGLSLDRARARSVMLAFPVYDKPHHQHEAAAMATAALLTQLGIRFGFAHAHQQPTHSARNMLAAAFLATDLTDILMIDSDICWEPWDVVRLLAQPHPYIGGIGLKRSPYPLTDLRAWCFGALDHEPAHDSSGAFEVKYLGTGFLLLNRLVFEAIERHGNPERTRDADGVGHTRFFHWGFEDGAELAEDYAMSRAYRAIGGKVMADPSIRLTHFGAAREHKGRLLDFIK